MNESATDVIVARANRRDSMAIMVAGSAAAHAVGFAVMVMAATLLRTDPPLRQVMMITLGGSSGPDTGGMTAIGGREVEKVAPPEPEKRVEPTPPAVPPKMTLPPEKPKPARKEEARRAPPEPAERPVTTGAQVTEGNTPVDTGVRGRGFGGLSSSGGNGPFSIKLDTGEFCCHEYLDAMLATIERNWRRNQGTTGATVMKFTILKSGRLDNIEIERTSGVGLLDLAAQRALDQTTLQPLPDRYTNPTLTVHITFQYWND